MTKERLLNKLRDERLSLDLLRGSVETDNSENLPLVKDKHFASAQNLYCRIGPALQPLPSSSLFNLDNMIGVVSGHNLR